MSVFNFLLAMICLFAVWTWSIRRGLNRLSCSRKFSCTAAFEGESGELVEVIRNDGPFIIPLLRLESCISPNLQLGKQDNFHVSGEMYYCSYFTLMPYHQVKRRHKVKFLHRGAYDLGNAALTTGDILGIYRFSRTQNITAPVLVYPHILEPEALPLPMSLMLGDMIRRRQLLDDPFLVCGIRAYQPGDPVRDIHWPATARTGETQVRVHDRTTRARLLVVLNVQLEDLQLKPYISESDAAIVEQGIRLAASMCLHALRSGLRAGFASNMPRIDSDESIVMLPAPGAVTEEELLCSFAKAQIKCVEKFPALLGRLAFCSGMDVLVLSSYDSESVRSGIAKLRQAGNQVSFHLLEGGSK